jgi:hypothetical protein
MEIRMNSYHYLVETLEHRLPSAPGIGVSSAARLCRGQNAAS